MLALSPPPRRVALGLGVLFGVITLGIGLGTAQSGPVTAAGTALLGWFPPATDLSKVMGADTCGECHARELEAWKQSTHFATWTAMHRKPEAREIASKMGEQSIKRNDLCYTCHYTAQLVDGAPKTISGVSCESCHGAAKDWTSTTLHHENAAKAASPTEREAILASCQAAGMIRPANVYDVAKNCYSCHTVPNEDLVNTGGHPAGSKFDLVAWSQGEVRHNYQHSPDETNRPATTEHLRVMYVVGAMTDLEYSLRGIAKATTRGAYTSAMVKRFRTSIARADAITSTVSLPELAAALPANGGKGLVKLNNAAALEAAADTLGAAIRVFAETHDGSQLAALDAEMPDASKYKGVAQP